MAEGSPFGVGARDEGAHPFDPSDEGWNESWFHDWTSPDGAEAGHCRVGWMPTQQRVWVWLVLRRGDRWLLLEAPHIHASHFEPSGWSVNAPSVQVSRVVVEPLSRSTLTIQATARDDLGRRVPVAVSLEFAALGPAHSLGASDLGEVAGTRLSANRFEQPVRVHGTVTIDGEARPLDGHGERDHSWGPRDWRMHWTFLAFSSPGIQLQAASVELNPGMSFGMGYIQDDRPMRHLIGVDFALQESPDTPMAPARGTVTLTDESGATLSGSIEPLGGTELDLSHVLRPAWRSRYHRAQVRFTPESGAPVIGWLELNRFPAGLDAVLEEP